jgi:hypothetical protein
MGFGSFDHDYTWYLNKSNAIHIVPSHFSKLAIWKMMIPQVTKAFIPTRDKQH